MWRDRAPEERVEWLLTAAISIAFAIPLAFAPTMPGGDTPWHAAVVAVLADDDPDRFLGFFAADGGFGSYVAVYRLLALLASAIGAVAAVKAFCLLVVIATVWAARSLARSFDADGAVGVLAAPAAYSTTFEFGFLVYLPCLPLALWTWAQVRTAMRHGLAPGRAAGLAAAWVGVGLCHPFAAAVAGAGAALLWLGELSRERAGRAALVAAILAVGALPAALALTASGSVSRIPGLAGAPLLDRITTQVFVPPLESIARAPFHAVGFVPPVWRTVIVGGLVVAALLFRLASRAPAAAEPVRSAVPAGRAAVYLFVVLAGLYLATPFTFEWPRNWYGAQPRLAPLVLVAGLVALAAGRSSVRAWPRAVALAVSGAALVCLEIGALLPYAAEARDLAAVLDRSAPAARTLGLVEQRPAEMGEPPDSFRNASGWVVAARGGYASHLPIAERGGLNSGQHIPVHLAAGAPPRPVAPMLGFPRSFRWEQHAAGWTQFLIRDLDPAHPHDYFGRQAASVETVARAGRWRLLRRVE